jgi:nitrate reductase gamma subunit
MKYFAFVNPKFNSSKFSIDAGDIMGLFFVFSFGTMVIVESAKLIMRKMFNINIRRPDKLKAKIVISFITAVYAIASILVTFRDEFNPDFYAIFTLFYLMNLGSVALYMLFGLFIKKVNCLVKPPSQINESKTKIVV